MATHICSALEKPELDDRSYRVIRLPNRLEVLLVHDPTTDKASASMDVNVGNFSDPEDVQGLAHCLEHALFMGTEKYPKENEYRQYLAANAGHSNAYTNQCNTNYYFEVAAVAQQGKQSDSAVSAAPDTTPTLPLQASPAVTLLSTPRDSTVGSTDGFSSVSPRSSVTDATSVSDCGFPDIHKSSQPQSPPSPLYGALDRFAQFFICPLFLRETLNRELLAVDSENRKNFQNDAWRLRQLSKTLSNPEHPYHKFICGSLQTLRDGPQSRGIDLREAVIQFYNKEYSANRMKLAVLGRESLDTLQGWVEELFINIKNRGLPVERWEGIESYPKSYLGKHIFVRSIMDRRELHMRFKYQDEDGMIDFQPGRYLMHLIGHEGPGSILSYLKAKDWASAVFVGPHPEGPNNAFFMLYIHLTEAGMRHHSDIIKSVFQYISLLRTAGPQPWIYEELKKLAEIDFRFKQKAPAMHFVSGIAWKMQKPLPRERLLNGYHVLNKFDPEGLRKALELLRWDNFNVTTVARQLPTEGKLEVDKWYGTEYKKSNLCPHLLQELRRIELGLDRQCPPELHLPSPNPFIPSDLRVERTVDPSSRRVPTLIRDDGCIRVWYKKDDTFWVPKASINLMIHSPIIDPSSRTLFDGVTSELYCKLVTDSFNEYSYDAAMTGYKYSLTPTRTGIEIAVSGFNDKLLVLLERILQTLRTLDVSPQQFERVKTDLRFATKNETLRDPYIQVKGYMEYLIAENAFTPEQRRTELENVYLIDINHFKARLVRDLSFEVLIHGNFSTDAALDIADRIANTRSGRWPASFRHATAQDLHYPSGNFIYRKTLPDGANKNNCTELALQIGSVDHAQLRAKAFLLEQLVEETAFDVLRTQEQLGYVVFSGTRIYSRALWFFFRVQSDRTNAYVESRIEAFIASFRTKLVSMSPAEFEEHKSSLIATLSKRWENLGAETDWYWDHVKDGRYHFEQRKEDVHNVRGLTKEDMLVLYDTYVTGTLRKRTKLAVHLNAAHSDLDDKASEMAGSTIISDVAKFKAGLSSKTKAAGSKRKADDGEAAARLKQLKTGGRKAQAVK